MPEQRLAASVNALFCRCPALCGFAVEHHAELFVSEVTIHPPGAAPHHELCGVIVEALAELIEEFPEAGELVHRRTFARVFH